MAPSKLSDANLESILWNKVSYAMQWEVGEMKEWILNELFSETAEARIMSTGERERHQQGTTSNIVSIQGEAKETTHSRQNSPVTGNSESQRGQTHLRPQTRNTVETRLRCCNCQELGHKASACPKTPRRETANMVTTNGRQGPLESCAICGQ